MKENSEGFSYPDEEPTRNWFKAEILTMCQEVFEPRPDDTDFQGLSDDKIELRRAQLKKKTIGNVKFIGELFKVGLLVPKIVLKCIGDLLIQQEAASLDEDKLEGSCVLLTTGGSMFESSHLREHTSLCIDKVEQILQFENLQPRFESY
jgi:translation initiation factor 4G